MKKAARKTTPRTTKKATKKAAQKTTSAAEAAGTQKATGTREIAIEDADPRFATIAATFVNNPRVTYGKMMASFGLKVDGKIFAMMVRAHFVAKLPKTRVDELISSKMGIAFDPRHDGKVMKEWIELADHPSQWLELAREAYRFVGKSS